MPKRNGSLGALGKGRRRARTALQDLQQSPTPSSRAYTLVEIVLVVALLVVISGIAAPTIYRQFKQEELPGSGKQLRSLLSFVRANAAMDGRRYRVRFPREEEVDSEGTDRQPLIEREDDPIHEPEVFKVVQAPWARGVTLLGEVWCAEVRLGKPTIESLRERKDEVAEEIKKGNKQRFERERPPMIVEPDGTSEWVTFLLTAAPRDTSIEDLEDHPRLEVILDGVTGLAWLQRPFYDTELDLFEEKNWPAVLAQDYLESTEITEDRVLELREFNVRPTGGESSTEVEGAN